MTEDQSLQLPIISDRAGHKVIPEIIEIPIDPFSYKRRETFEIENIGGKNVPVVVITADNSITDSPAGLLDFGYSYNIDTDKWNIADAAPDFLYLGKNELLYNSPGSLKRIYDYEYWLTLENNSDSYPFLNTRQYLDDEKKSERINFVAVSIEDINDGFLNTIKNDKTIVLILKTENLHAMAEQRRVFFELLNRDVKTPVIIHRRYGHLVNEDKLVLYGSTDFGGLLTDGLGDGIWLEAPHIPIKEINNISFGILQAARTRISKTEYIACPSCGRTQFDLQVTTAKIRNKTSHLKDVKIAVMGCIVNGPGEMADADFGYVGSGPGKITLYKGKDVVQRGIDEEVAVDKLIELIKENGMWVEDRT